MQIGSEMQSVKQESRATGVNQRQTQGFESFGCGPAKSVQILEIGSREFLEFAAGGGAEVELAVMEAEGLAAECGGPAFPAVGHNVTTFDESGHECAPPEREILRSSVVGVPPHFGAKGLLFLRLGSRLSGQVSPVEGFSSKLLLLKQLAGTDWAPTRASEDDEALLLIQE